MVNNVIIYSKTVCPYCIMAKRFLISKRLEWKEINIESSNDLRKEMIKRSNGRKTVPQIFINEHHIGGYDDLKRAGEDGLLDNILNQN